MNSGHCLRKGQPSGFSVFARICFFHIRIGTAFDSVPGPDYDGWLLAGIFIPGLVVPVLLFRSVSLATQRHAAEPKATN